MHFDISISTPHTAFTHQKNKKPALSNHCCKKSTTNRKKSKMLAAYPMTMTSQMTVSRKTIKQLPAEAWFHTIINYTRCSDYLKSQVPPIKLYACSLFHSNFRKSFGEFMKQNLYVPSWNIKALKLSLFYLLINLNVVTAAQSQQIHETGTSSAFGLDVSIPGMGKHPLHGSLKYCYHQLTPCCSDEALRSYWSLHQERLESNQGSHTLARSLSEEMRGIRLFLSILDYCITSYNKLLFQQ